MAGLRIFRLLMDQSATHERNTPTKDSLGGDVAVWGNVASNKPCALWPVDQVPDMAAIFARRDIVCSHIACFDEDLGATAEDRLVINDLYYVVQGVAPYANTGIMSRPLYLVAVDLRTV